MATSKRDEAEANPTFPYKLGWPSLLTFHRDQYKYIANLRVQTKDERKTESLLGREYLGVDNLIPYNAAIDHDELTQHLEFLKQHGPAIEAYLKKKELSLEFLRLWGEYRASCGYILCAIDMKNDGLGKERTNFKNSATQCSPQMQWFCNYVGSHLKKKIPRKIAVRWLVDHLQKILDGKIPVPESFDCEWFTKMLIKKYDASWHTDHYHDPLKSTYHISNLSDKKILEKSKRPRFKGLLPPLNF